MLRQNWPATFGFAVFGVLAVIAAAILLTSTSTDAYLISGALLALAVGQASAALVQDGRFRALDQQELERGRSQHELSQSVGRLAERLNRTEEMLTGPDSERTGAIAGELNSLRETVSGLMRDAAIRPRLPDMAPPANQVAPEPARERLDLLLEPVVELSSGKTEHYRALAQMTGGPGGPVDHGILMAKADEGGLRGALDLHLMRLALPVLRRLRQRHPNLRMVVPVGRPTLENTGDMARLVRAIDAELRHRWPDTGRVALIHRTGMLGVTESSVLACVSAPHRPEAFEAARFAIDALKASAPIWKRETWSDGTDWGTGATAPVPPAAVPSVGGGRS